MVRIAALAVSLSYILLAGTPALAGPAQCEARIAGETVTIYYDADDPAWSSRRERLFSRGRTCPAALVITYLLPDLSAAEREVFCANVDPATGDHSLPAQGRRDAWGRCVEPSRTCRLVNTTRDAALDLAGLGRAAETGESAPRLAAAVSVVTHWSGAMILSGNAASIGQLLASAGGTVGTALASPAVLAGAAASLVVIGGAVWLCDED